MAHFIFDLVRGIIRFTPYPLFRVKAWVITWVLYLVSKRLRRTSMESLGIAFGESLSLKKKNISPAGVFSA